MTKKLLILAALVMAGCTTNGQFDSGKTALLVGAVVIGSLAASSGNSENNGSNCYWVVGSNGSTQVCDR